ncbi:MAG TPA: TonB-dependent receptor [Longimicrobium sp.]|nr:TonB-dependent receptor [Longimicrobium sp.]
MRRFRWALAGALALALLPAAARAQERGTIRGRVTEQTSERPLPGVQVAVQGTNLTALTDPDGRYTLNNVPARTQTVRATRIGYGTATRAVAVAAGATAEANFSLAVDALGLEEVVAIGYGNTERRNVAGAISSIRPAELSDIPTPQIENVLQGRAAGVQVTQNSGVPGAAMTVRVRGASSIDASNQPLFVIDGVPLIQGNFSGINGSMGGQDVDALADLNPNEIESIEILKDASSAAIYGSRGSNGVVLITTKRGRAATRPDIQFNAFYGSQRAWRVPGFLNTAQYVELYNDAYTLDGLADYEDDEGRPVHENYIGYLNDGVVSCDDRTVEAVCDVNEVDPGVDTDWVREVLQTAPIANMFGSIAGGTEKTRYYVGGTYFTQDGIVAAYGYNRLNGRVNLDYSATDRLTLGTSVALTRSVTDRARGDNTIYGPFANAIATDPLTPVRDEDGGYAASGWAGYDNAVGLMNENRAEERAVHILGNAFARYNVAEGVEARVAAGLDHYNLRSRQYDSPIIGPWTGSGGHGAASNSYATKLLGEGTLNASRDFGSHSLSGLFGTSYEIDRLDFNEVEGVQFPTGQFRKLTSAALIIAGDQYITEANLLSFFGRASHSWADRLTTTLNVRADGSSRFGDNNRWGLFPSASVLWRLDDTPLIRGQSFVSNLALRGSYGLTGNQQGIGNYASFGLFAGGFNYGDLAGIAPLQLPNPDLSWEKTAQLNVGLDVGLFDERLALSFDWYRKNTTDLLLDRPIPLSTGFGILTENIGAMRNTGVELSARAHWARGEAGAFSWSTELNVSTNRNRVTELYGDDPITLDEVRIQEGQPLGVFYTYVMDGIFQEGDDICYDPTGDSCAPGTAFQNDFTVAGDVRFRDVNGDGVINSDDRDVVGNPWPDFQGGLTNTLGYRGLDLTVFVQFTQGNDIFNGNRLYTDAYGYFFDNSSDRALDRWRPDAPSTTEPRASWFDDNQNRRSSSRFIEDGSYVRLKNVVLGYNIPTRTSRRFGVGSLRLYVQGQNLVTWTDYSGFDPEVNYAGDSNVTRGYDFYTLPQARTLSFGVNLGL